MKQDAREIGPTERLCHSMIIPVVRSIEEHRPKVTMGAIIDARETLNAIVLDHETFLHDKAVTVSEGIRRRNEQTACRKVITILDAIIKGKRIGP